MISTLATVLGDICLVDMFRECRRQNLHV